MKQLIGISLDETLRVKPSFEGWQVNRWPLIEPRMSRWGSFRWPERHGAISANTSEAWADAVDLDRTIRTGLRGIRGEVYLHRSAAPPDQVDLTTDADRGQLDLWSNGCEGVCGV